MPLFLRPEPAVYSLDRTVRPGVHSRALPDSCSTPWRPPPWPARELLQALTANEPKSVSHLHACSGHGQLRYWNRQLPAFILLIPAETAARLARLPRASRHCVTLTYLATPVAGSSPCSHCTHACRFCVRGASVPPNRMFPA